jgi:imidazoleglycerol phosphate synthase cyclase subunit
MNRSQGDEDVICMAGRIHASRQAANLLSIDPMLYHRVIPVLLFDNGAIYRGQQFARHYRLGDPFRLLERYKAWDVDEIVYLDMHRTPDGTRLLDVLPEVGRNCFAPLAVGGGIRSIEDIHRHLEAGADRVVINTAAVETPGFITDAAHQYGEQAIVVSIDARRRSDGSHEVIVDSGRRPTGLLAGDWAADAASRGAGEILINSMDRDGMGTGYDIELLRAITARVSIPVIACGGVGEFRHLADGIGEGGAASVAAANIFGFKELSYPLGKDALRSAGVSVRAAHLRSGPSDR